MTHFVPYLKMIVIIIKLIVKVILLTGFLVVIHLALEIPSVVEMIVANIILLAQCIIPVLFAPVLALVVTLEIYQAVVLIVSIMEHVITKKAGLIHLILALFWKYVF